MSTPPTRYSSADRREQILEVATGLFAQQGFQGTTTKVIAEKSGVTEALIFRHFASKEELYWAVIERKINCAAPLERLVESLEAGGDDLEVLSRVALEVLARFVRQGIAAGRFRDIDPLLAARGFLGMVVYHSWIQELYRGKEVQDFDLHIVSRTLARIWLQGVQSEKKSVRKTPKLLPRRKRLRHQVQ